MRRSTIPSLNALAAFESVARHRGLVGAAQELSLSQSAISKLVRQVEEAVHVRLFDRRNQRLLLTEAGKAYARDMRELLGGLDRSPLQVMSYGSSGYDPVLNLGVFPTFGIKWLMPRLGLFRARYPDIIVSCYSRPQPFSFENDPLDGAFHFGKAVWADAAVEPLFGERLVPVCSANMPRLDRLKRPRDIVGFPLLHEMTRPWAWKNWLEGLGIGSDAARLGARYDQFMMVFEAAKAGLGVGLVPEFLFRQEIKAGEVIVPFEAGVPSDERYHFVYPMRSTDNPAVKAFSLWLHEIARDGER